MDESPPQAKFFFALPILPYVAFSFLPLIGESGTSIACGSSNAKTELHLSR